jgi:hypothetical protein
MLATAKGLRIGDTIRFARRAIYGPGLRVSPVQGGVWSVKTPQGIIQGFTSRVTQPNGKILSIEAGDVRCPAMAP